LEDAGANCEGGASAIRPRAGSSTAARTGGNDTARGVGGDTAGGRDGRVDWRHLLNLARVASASFFASNFWLSGTWVTAGSDASLMAVSRLAMAFEFSPRPA
jgi:hypothetical protein